MSTFSSRRLIAVLALISVCTFSTPAQQQIPSPDEKPRKITPETKKAYRDWIENHELILTQPERDAWKKLATDEERDRFIEDFWRARDPDPDTERTSSDNSSTNASPTQTNTFRQANPAA